MDAFAEMLGVTAQDLTQLLILVVVLVVGWFLLRLFFKLTAAVFRVGCFGILLIIGAVYVLQLFG
ncbi:MAG: hypothetical protein H6662_05240 [Ardenticatenaceae bacterium]|nr:hypothetical protein [Anaerolineales bacterium]MCB8920972.1 hypothetical protein [Ardenticatenaceae bacterium]MCB8991603.1 hypothetical protein [Ardenticatenaceae bacterium]MCB9004232.1 hypothetical protein [Ardenticatenaceae bacterium]